MRFKLILLFLISFGTFVGILLWRVDDFVKKDNHIALIGNHDMHYMHSNRNFQCSGYEQWKYFLINDIVQRDTWDKLRGYHVLDNTWLLSHAGLHKEYIPINIQRLALQNKTETFKTISEYLDQEMRKGLRDESWIFHAGHIRGGNQKYGGLMWCDSREFTPTTGLNQIFGHTVSNSIRWKNLIKNQTALRMDLDFSPPPEHLSNNEYSYNVCIDTGISHYAVWNQKELKIHWIGDL